MNAVYSWTVGREVAGGPRALYTIMPFIQGLTLADRTEEWDGSSDADLGGLVEESDKMQLKFVTLLNSANSCLQTPSKL